MPDLAQCASRPAREKAEPGGTRPTLEEENRGWVRLAVLVEVVVVVVEEEREGQRGGKGERGGAVPGGDGDGGYSIDRRTDMDRVFNVHAGNGSVFVLRELDREEAAWHNISIIATEFNAPRQMTRVPVFVRILDVNDNAPTFATNYETFVCENARANQRIQTVSASDPDDPVGGHRFVFSLAPEEASGKANFSVRDNKDNTAWVLTRRNSYLSLQRSVHLVPVVISDGEHPALSSTSTLTVRVCTCDRHGNMQLCNAEALAARAGLSTGALVAILLCSVILLMIVVLCSSVPSVIVVLCSSTFSQ
ncbi:unnamed protein product [Boreogadus saida]